MPRAAAKKPTTKKAKKTVTKDLQVSMKKAGNVKAALASAGGPRGTIWWNPIPIQPAKGKRTSSTRVGAYRKG